MPKAVGYHAKEEGDNKKVGMGCADVFDAARVCCLRDDTRCLQPRTMKRADAVLTAGLVLRPDKNRQMEMSTDSPGPLQGARRVPPVHPLVAERPGSVAGPAPTTSNHELTKWRPGQLHPFVRQEQSTMTPLASR